MAEQALPSPSAEGARTLAEQALTALQNAIVQGELAPGTKLSEPDLARRYGVSRGPLREALRRLEARRLIQVAPRTGARVVSLTVEQLEALYQTREALEGMAARLAAARMAQADIDGLRRLLDRHQRSIEEDEGRRYYQHEGDVDFHFQVVRGAANPLLAGVLLDDLYHLLRMYRFNHSHRDAHRARPHKALTEHRHIVDAIAARDGELAELLMRRHIAAAGRFSLKTAATPASSIEERSS